MSGSTCPSCGSGSLSLLGVERDTAAPYVACRCHGCGRTVYVRAGRPAPPKDWAEVERRSE